MKQPSWRLKLHRAKEHLRTIGELIGYPPGRQPCPVTEVLNADGKFEYSISIPGAVDQMVPIVAGDCLFNIRSALDHLVCALIPSEDKGPAQFPIFTTDPLRTDSVTGAYRDTNARSRWLSQTRGIPSGPLAIITELQPFNQAGNDTEKAQHHTLAVLSTLQNADKHRELVFSRPGIKQVVVSVPNHLDLYIVGSLYDGAVFLAQQESMDVKVEGTFTIPFGIGQQVRYEYPLMFDMILDFVARDVLPALEQHLPSSGVL